MISIHRESTDQHAHKVWNLNSHLHINAHIILKPQNIQNKRIICEHGIAYSGHEYVDILVNIQYMCKLTSYKQFELVNHPYTGSSTL